MKKIKCCFCGKDIIQGFGNNPSPVRNQGECCDICNLQKVIPERIMVMQMKSKLKKK